MSEIDQKHQKLGGAGGILGKPIAPERDCADGKGRFRRYEHGRIYFSAETGAHELRDAILTKWLTLGAEQSALGYPITDRLGVDGPGDATQHFNEFQHGAIYSTPDTGAHELRGEILKKWRADDGKGRKEIGFPITDRRLVSDGVGRYNDFERGSIYWSPETGAHLIYGGIYGKWMAIGGPRSALGYPTTDEEGPGHRFNLFQGGSIYWRDGFGAFFVRGEIDEKWAAQGREQGFGFPLSDELPGTQFNTRFNRFEGGTLTRVVPPPAPVSTDGAAPPFASAFDLDTNAIASKHAVRAADGFRLLSLSVYGPPADPLYAAVWVKEGGPEQKVLFKATAPDYLKFLNDRIDDEFLPVIISATGPANKAVFALVCEKRPGGRVPIVRHRLTAGPEDGIHHPETFAFWCQWARANNHILRWASIYGDDDDPRYAGIWELDRNAVPWNVAYHDAQHKLAHNVMPEAGPELLDKGELAAVIKAQSFWARPAFRTRGAGRQLVVFREDRAGKSETRPNLTGSQIDSEAGKLKMIPVCVQGTRGNGSSRFTVVYAERVRPQARKLTVTGQEINKLAALDDAMGDMLRKSGARNGSLAVARNGRLVYARAFTWAEPDQTPIEPFHTFRIASISKSITAVAVYQLMPDEVALNKKLIHHLPIDLPENVDPRFQQIRIRQMLTHHSGLQGGTADSITQADDVLAFFEEKQLPLTMADVGTYSASLPLDFDPNNDFDDADPKKESYSNLAFLYLAWLVEQKRGSYVKAVRQHIFDPIGLPKDRPRITGSLTSTQGDLEVLSLDRELRVGRSVMSEQRPIVPHEYGTLNFNVTPGAGGWAMAPADYVRFLSKLFDQSDTLLPSSFLLSPFRTQRELVEIKKHGGGLAGSETFAEHFEHDGGTLAYAVFFNKDVPGDFTARIRDVITALDKSAWPLPPFDLFGTLGIQ